MSGKLLLGVFVQTGVWLILTAGLLFVPAGNWHWPQAWAFLGLFVAGSIAMALWLGRRDPDLLAARLGGPVQQDQPRFDRVFFLSVIALWCLWFVLMALDAQRWHHADFPLWLNTAGGVALIGGFAATMRVFHENSFAASVVRLQHDRGQRVIDTGPYALVRHPMYAASSLCLAAIPLILGSWYGLAVVPLIIASFGRRAMGEERTLARDLPGYADYMDRVRYRLIPGLW